MLVLPSCVAFQISDFSAWSRGLAQAYPLIWGTPLQEISLMTALIVAVAAADYID